MVVSSKESVTRINRLGYGVRSGVYTAIDPRIAVQINPYGEYQYIFSDDIGENVYKQILKVDLMSNESVNEDTISHERFSAVKDIQYDNVIGYYTDLYIGHIVEGDYRVKGSSGGFTTWILCELLKQKKIDGVIHVQAIDPIKNDGRLFKYVISRNTEEVKAGAKSRYYPMEMSEVLKVVKETPGRYAIVAIPEFITELRLLAREDTDIGERIKYMIGLLCGHQKTAKYAEALAWQHGIKPGDLRSIDFRVKQPQSTAIDYLHEFTGLIDGKKQILKKTHAELFGEVWAYGLFKSKFSDFTDNVFNENADITLGDAWLPAYNNDGLGNNIVIVRNPDIADLINQATASHRIKVDKVGLETIKDSQRGLIHHIRDELPYRLYKQSRLGGWVPVKRVKPSCKLSFIRRRVQNIRYDMAINSHRIYRDATLRQDWQYFESRMEIKINKYMRLYSFINKYGDDIVDAARKHIKLRTRVRQLYYTIKTVVRPRTRIRTILSYLDDMYSQMKYNNADGAILTLSGYFNYGNILQRYALQKFLAKKGYNFVSYFQEAANTDDAAFGSSRQAIKDFVKQYVITKSPNGNDRYKNYIVGSDQVWRNWDYPDEQTELGYYFFNFIGDKTAKKIAYAASFGVDTLKAARISDSFVDYARPFIRQFTAIGMREESGVDLVKQTWGVDARKVVDPTMLLTASDYSILIDKSPHALRKPDGIFTYFLHLDELRDTIVANISRTTSYKVTSFTPKTVDTLPPVEQWLIGFRDAKIVITDSFHGVVFAIINNTPFVVLENAAGGLTRIKNLLEQFSLEDRLVEGSSTDGFLYENLPPIDWDGVNVRLDEYRKDSGNWLIKNIVA